MRVVELRDGFGIDNLHLTERAEPSPGPGQVRVEVTAASLNYRDVLMVEGQYDPRQALPLIPLSDGVGVVAELGEGVEGLEVGDRVLGLFNQRWMSGELRREMRRSTLGGPLDGMLAESVLLRAEGVVPAPSYLSDEEASTLPCAALTAWSALHGDGGLRPGDTVLVQGTGGVASFALQLALAAGAEVIVTSSRDEKLARAREIGAHHGINYEEEPRWDRRVKELTGGRGADVVVEVGGAGTLAWSLGAVRTGGRVAVIGVLAGRAGELDLAPILMQRVRVQGVMVGNRDQLEALVRCLELHELHPVVDRVFPLEEAADAFRLMAAGGHQGKLVVRVR